MVCERCRANDGRQVNEYAVKGSKRVFCDVCARLTAAIHDISPQPPEAPEAEATDAEESKDQESGEESTSTSQRRRRRN